MHKYPYSIFQFRINVFVFCCAFFLILFNINGLANNIIKLLNSKNIQYPLRH